MTNTTITQPWHVYVVQQKSRCGVSYAVPFVMDGAYVVPPDEIVQTVNTLRRRVAELEAEREEGNGNNDTPGDG